ncbi:MAG: FtsX-like permease family protein, partial [Albidovulum sp.]
MNLLLSARIARREMRGGLRGFAVFLACLALGVAAITAVGTVRGSITAALTDQGAVLLGGDAQMSFTYRYASAEERAFMAARADKVSEIVDFRSMAVVGEGDAAERALTQVKAVDDAYPLTGQLLLDPPMSPAGALGRDAQGVAGAVMDGVLVDRLGLAIGDRFRLGLTEFRLAARISRESDNANGGFALGPRTIVHSADLAGSGLLEPGSLFDSRYRLLLADKSKLDQLGKDANAAFRSTGMGWRDARWGAPGVQRFVDRMGSFLVLVGLAGLAVGGVGIASAVRSYLDGKIETMAALKAMGAESRLIFAIYLMQVGVLALAGVALGLILGAGLPVLAGPYFAAQLPIPVTISLTFRPLAEAAIYGFLTAALFALWPLARTRDVKAAALFRDLGAGRRAVPGWGMTAVLAALLAILVAVA